MRPDARHINNRLFTSTLDQEGQKRARDVVRPQHIHRPGLPPLLRVRVRDEAERLHVPRIVDDKIHTAERRLDFFGGVCDFGGVGGVDGEG